MLEGLFNKNGELATPPELTEVIEATNKPAH